MNSEKKIALLNIQQCNSHGAVLLAYALEKILISGGYEVQNINYKYAGRIVEKSLLKKIYKTIIYKCKKQWHLGDSNRKVLGMPIKSEYSLQKQKFDEFRKNNLHLTRKISDVYDSILQQFDIFIVGSDVVWKPEIVACEDREIYFLRSVPENALKIAYAASIGTDDEEILQKFDQKYQGAFDKFDYISVREQSMIPFLKKYTIKNIVNVIDPVFLLEPDDYISIEKDSLRNVHKKTYVYVYLIGANETAVREANKFAKKHSLSILLDLNESFQYSELVTVNAESAISAGPAEFLYNIRNAEYVITDSFHASSFSLIFNINFCVFKRGKISVRMSDLLSKFKLKNRMYDGMIPENNIDWSTVNEKIRDERNKGMKFLLDSIGDKYGKCQK